MVLSYLKKLALNEIRKHTQNTPDEIIRRDLNKVIKNYTNVWGYNDITLEIIIDQYCKFTVQPNWR
jgi:hypothetical protein